MVPDRPIVTIIDRQELIYSLSSHTMTCGDPEGYTRSHFTKNTISQPVFDPETSG